MDPNGEKVAERTWAARATIEAVRREFSAGGPLLYRYPPGRDGLPDTEGAFLPTSNDACAETQRSLAIRVAPAAAGRSWQKLGRAGNEPAACRI